MLPTEGGEHFIKKIEQQIELEEVLRHKSIRRKQTMHKQMKMSGVLQTSIFAEEALVAKSARDCSQKQYFEGQPKPKNEKPIGTKGDKCQKSNPRVIIWGLEGFKQFFL